MRPEVEYSNSLVGEETHSNGVDALLTLWLAVMMLLWMLAFLELPAESGSWLRRTQLACFGTDESGMPSTAGWMILTLGPLMFLGGLVVALPGECRAFFDSIRRQHRRRIALGVVLVLLCAEAAWVSRSIYLRLYSGVYVSIEQTLEHLPANYPMGTAQAPDFSLVDQNGKTTTLSAFRGSPVLLTFVFAHCQAVCPVLVQSVTSAHRSTIAKDAVVLFVTLDPWRDTPGRLADLATEWKLGSNEFFLSGAPEKVNAVLDDYGMPRDRDQKNGDVVHPAIVKVINRKGEVAYTFNAPTATWLKDAVDRISQ